MDVELKREIDGFFAELLQKWRSGRYKSLEDLMNTEINQMRAKEKLGIGNEEDGYFNRKTDEFIDSAILGSSGTERI